MRLLGGKMNLKKYNVFIKEYAASVERFGKLNDIEIENNLAMAMYKTLKNNCLCYGDKIEWRVLPEIKYNDKEISIYTRFRFIRKKRNWFNKLMNKYLILNKPWNTTEWSLKIFNNRLLNEYKQMTEREINALNR